MGTTVCIAFHMTFVPLGAVEKNHFQMLSNIDLILYTNIDQKLGNKLHEPMYYKVGATCVLNESRFILTM